MEPNTTYNNTENQGNKQAHGGLVGLIIALMVVLIAAGTYLYYNKVVAPTKPEESDVATAKNCGLFVDSPKEGEAVSFPLTLTGRVDNTDAEARRCAWTMFEGQAGTAALSYETKDGWSLPVDTKPVTVANWMSTSTTFSVTLNFNNSTEQFPAGYNFKVVFTEEDPSGMGKVDTVEVPVVLK